MEVAVKNYLLRSKAIDLDRLAIIRQNFWLEGQSELSILQKQLQNLKKKSVFSQEEEMQLQDIEQQVGVISYKIKIKTQNKQTKKRTKQTDKVKLFDDIEAVDRK